MDVHLLPAAGCYLYSSGRGEERSQTTLALALLLGGEEEEGLEEVKSYLLDGKGERVTSSLTYAEPQTSQVRARHWQWKANCSVAEIKMISHIGQQRHFPGNSCLHSYQLLSQ